MGESRRAGPADHLERADHRGAPTGRTVALFAAVVLAGAAQLGCGPEPVKVMVQTEQPTYTTAMFADATVTNEDAQAINFSPCETKLQFFDPAPSEWTDLAPRTGCTDELRVLQPGESTRFTWFLNRTLPGRYRFEVSVRVAQSAQAVHSNEFSVVE